MIIKLDGYETASARRSNSRAPRHPEVSVALEKMPGEVADPGAGEPAEGQDGGNSLKTWGWVTTGAGVALLGTGTVFSLLKTQRSNQVNDYDKRGAASPTQGRQEIEELKDQANRLTTGPRW